jgi:glutamate/tyrosine decarboxylase-like PLP-dependent enzyme
MKSIDDILEPEYLSILKRKYFLSPDASNTTQIFDYVKIAVESLTNNQGKSPTYPNFTGISQLNNITTTGAIPEAMLKDPKILLEKLYTMMSGSVKAGHPFMVKNLIPTSSLPALATYLAVSLYMGNAVTAEDAGQALSAELACAQAIASLAGYDPIRSAGVFTFGGTGTNLYAMKIGLSKVLPYHGRTGINSEKLVVIESSPAHYSHQTGANWLGIGQDNCLRVPSLPDQTTDLEKLEQLCTKVVEEGYKIICINIVGGTTSNLGIDDAQKVFNIRQRLIEKHHLGYTPHIHMDAVLGWAYLNFRNYDFSANPLMFSDQGLIQIKKILSRISTIKYADSFGVDFHKTGYVAYTSSMIIVKEKSDFSLLKRDGDIMTPLFHDNQAYNPGIFTLETSRSTANILATWIALQTFGKTGYQCLLGHAIEMGIVFQNNIDKFASAGMYVANRERFGPDVFVRCYPPGTDCATAYQTEMSNDTVLKINTGYLSGFYKWLDAYLPQKEEGFSVSKSSAAIYTHTGQPMAALRIYPLSPYITSASAVELIRRLAVAKQEYDQKSRNL